MKVQGAGYFDFGFRIESQDNLGIANLGIQEYKKGLKPNLNS
jgi:hypothetical protein